MWSSNFVASSMDHQCFCEELRVECHHFMQLLDDGIFGLARSTLPTIREYVDTPQFPFNDAVALIPEEASH